MRIRYPLISILGLLITAQSQAEGFFDKPAILAGGSVGQFALTDEHFISPSNIATATYVPVGDTLFDGFDTRAAAWNVFAGFEFNRYLTVEIGRLSGGNVGQEKGEVLQDDLTARVTEVETTELKTAAWHLSALGSWPINDYVSVFVRGGMAHWQSTLKWRNDITIIDRTVTPNQTLVGIIPNLVTPLQRDNKGNDPYYGAGLSINIDSGLIRLEYDLTKIDGFDARNISLSVIWRFRPW